MEPMDEIKAQHQMLDEKIEELQQQVRFCVNNYDYYHKDNEIQILQEQLRKLKESNIVYKSFLNDMRKFREMLDQGHRYCDEVDELLEETLRNAKVPATEDEDEIEEDKENKFQRKKNMHVHFGDA